MDVGGHRLLQAGGPTVVFEAGGASWSLDWSLVQSEVASFTHRGVRSRRLRLE